MIENFLADRKFQVKIENEFSSIRKIECGVPQGAVLSPTLFSIYINDLPLRRKVGLSEENHEFNMLFADDIGYLLSFKHEENATRIAQSYLNELEKWMNLWRLSLAPHKCAQIVFSRAKKFDIIELDVSLYGIKIPRDISPKFLGVVFDRRLNFHEQIQNIRKKTSDRLSIIKTLSYDQLWKLDNSVLIKLYKTLVRSIIEYSSVIIGSVSQSFIKKLEAIQNNALRAIYQESWEDMREVGNRPEDLREKSKIQTIENRLKQLNERYIEKALLTRNPFVDEMIEDYLTFRARTKIDPKKALNDQQLILEINLYNLEQENTPEPMPTLLCRIEAIKDMRSDVLPP
jgi:hypothetical protein